MRTPEHPEAANTRGGGLAMLTGRPGGPPVAPPPELTEGLDGLGAAVARWSERVGRRVQPDWEELVTVRAATLGLRRQGRTSPNGSCRLLRGAGGWVALNLARPEDVAAVPAIVEGDVGADPWRAIQTALVHRGTAEVVARARLLGVPAAPLGDPEESRGRGVPWSSEARWASSSSGRDLGGLVVVDLSSMWAGPLASAILAACGGRVRKVESAARPDGARRHPGFYRTLHAEDQEVVTLDLTAPGDLARLRTLVEEADIVVESSRRRALEQLGAGPDTVGGPAGKVWLSITGYGRNPPGRDWV
ncbi:MAG TPA: CoA transferase, partial [Acidimicrobiales bacterium]|nr:CoA transferase [Acidimicrobiales bacterium]